MLEGRKYFYLVLTVSFWVSLFSMGSAVFVWGQTCDFSITSSYVTPSSLRAPGNIATAQTLTYTFVTTPLPGDVPGFAPPTREILFSQRGEFRVGSTVIGENNTPLTVDIINTRGTKSETVTILPSVTQRALSMGSTKISYRRDFYCNIYLFATLQVEITITTEAGADFRITRMQLYFQNRQPVITVKRNDSTLRTYAEINYVGSGLLQGYWEVDGSFLSNVMQPLSSGTSVIIESPPPPVLPTFISGTHRIRLVLTNPAQNIPFPEISYYVATEEPKKEVKKLIPLTILFPHDNSVIDHLPLTFLWTARDGAVIYFLEFYPKGKEKSIFSAYTRNSNYNLRETNLRKFFIPGKAYTWKVRGFDQLNREMTESSLFTFTIRE